MKRLILSTCFAFIITSIFATHINAQQTSYDLKKSSSQYTTSGTVSITKNGSSFTYGAVVKDLPATLPANGIYYLLWGLNAQGKAINLGPITNSSENRGSLNERVTQFFITSEKERHPEFVSGPRIAQTDTIAESVFTGIASATPSPTTRSSASPSSTNIPVGGPTDAPETGLGGSLLFNGIIYSLGAIGFTGLTLSVYNKLKQN